MTHCSATGHARFSILISDADSPVGYANATINGVVYDMSYLSGTTWHRDWVCSSSDSNVDFTQAAARDTAGNSNQTSVTGVYLVCDANSPSISGETRTPDPVHNDDNVVLNATITDPEGNLNEVWIGGNWTGSWQNYTEGIGQSGSIYSYMVTSGNLSNQESVGGGIMQGTRQATSWLEPSSPSVCRTGSRTASFS